MSATSKWAGRILTALVIVAFVPGGIMKTARHPMAVEGFGRIGIPDGALVPLGIVELFCLVLYVFPQTAVLGTFLLTGYLGGATLANLISGTDFLHALAVGLLVWAGAWFRVPELRTLLPFRRPAAGR